jgi:hypothetical protein
MTEVKRLLDELALYLWVFIYMYSRRSHVSIYRLQSSQNFTMRYGVAAAEAPKLHGLLEAQLSRLSQVG